MATNDNDGLRWIEESGSKKTRRFYHIYITQHIFKSFRETLQGTEPVFMLYSKVLCRDTWHDWPLTPWNYIRPCSAPWLSWHIKGYFNAPITQIHGLKLLVYAFFVSLKYNFHNVSPLFTNLDAYHAETLTHLSWLCNHTDVTSTQIMARLYSMDRVWLLYTHVTFLVQPPSYPIMVPFPSPSISFQNLTALQWHHSGSKQHTKKTHLNPLQWPLDQKN